MSRFRILGLTTAFACVLTLGHAGVASLTYAVREAEPNDARATANPLISTTGNATSLWFDADRDFFRLDVDRVPTTISLVTTPQAGNDTVLRLTESDGALLAENDDIQPGVDYGSRIDWEFLTTGTFYVSVFHPNKAELPYNEDTPGYQFTVEIMLEDNDPPSYTGDEGIQSAAITAQGTASVEWNQAEDEFTIPGRIIYNVYWSQVFADLYTAPGESVTGALSLIIPGLEPGAGYYFAVRAEDGAGNEEQNDKYILVHARSGVPYKVWPLYR
jgi:hypothetical protein